MGLWRIVCECCPLRDDAGEFPGGPVVMTAGGKAWILSGGTESLHAHRVAKKMKIPVCVQSCLTL